jgi:hypothetical protein
LRALAKKFQVLDGLERWRITSRGGLAQGHHAA